MGAKDPPPGKQGKQHIQMPFTNTFGTIWEYRESFLAGQIDFTSFIGPICPICGEKHCYREITPYWRYAIDLFPEYKKERIPVARFLCRGRGKDILLAADPVDPLFSVHGPSSDWRPAVGLEVMGIRTARFLRCNGASGPRQQGNAMVGIVLVHGDSQGFPTRPCDADAMVRSFRHPQP